MRTAFRSSVRALFLLGVVLTAACASTAEETANTPAAGAGAGAAMGESVVSVENNHSSFNAMTIFLEPEGGGVRQSLGVIEAGQTRNFPLTLQRGWYVLQAQHSGGDFRSDRFNVPGRSTVTWDLRLNRVRVATRS